MSDSDSDYEEEAINEPVRKRRQPRSNTSRANRAPAAKPASVASTTSNASSRENMRERLEAFYGSSDQDLVEAIQFRARWSNLIFSLLPNQLEPLPQWPKTSINDEALSPLLPLSSSSSKEKTFPAGHSCVVDGVSLSTHEIRSDGVSSILNVGYCITSMDWSSNILVVGAAETEERPIDISSLTNFRQGPTLINIYDTAELSTTGKVQFVGSLHGEQNKGAPLCIRLRPGSADIAAIFGNGHVSVIRFNRSDYGKEAQRIVDLRSITSAELGDATKLAWRTNDCLVVGFSEGWIAEFDLSQPDWMNPSYVIKAHSSIISALTTGSPNHPTTIFSSCVDGWSAVHDITDLRNVRRPPRVRFYSGVSAYVPLIQSFVTLEDADTSKLVILRHPSQSQAVSTLTRHNGIITSVASSFLHPIIASGAQDGTLNLANSLRRTMITRRQKDGIQDLWMWQLECSHKRAEYRFVVHNQVNILKHKRLPANLQVYPPSVCITELAWHETWLATATAAGLIRFDNICS